MTSIHNAVFKSQKWILHVLIIVVLQHIFVSFLIYCIWFSKANTLAIIGCSSKIDSSFQLLHIVISFCNLHFGSLYRSRLDVTWSTWTYTRIIILVVTDWWYLGDDLVLISHTNFAVYKINKYLFNNKSCLINLSHWCIFYSNMVLKNEIITTVSIIEGSLPLLCHKLFYLFLS